jgi:transposase-like protein
LSQPYLQALIEIELPDLMPTYDDKRQAVDFVAPSIYSIGSAAKELGLRDSVLRRWVEPQGWARAVGGSRGRDRPFSLRERAAA